MASYSHILELQQHLKQELTANPFLELVEEDEELSATPDVEDAELPDEDTSEEREEPVDRGRADDDESRWEEFVLAGEDAEGEREAVMANEQLPCSDVHSVASGAASRMSSQILTTAGVTLLLSLRTAKTHPLPGAGSTALTGDLSDHSHELGVGSTCRCEAGCRCCGR